MTTQNTQQYFENGLTNQELQELIEKYEFAYAELQPHIDMLGEIKKQITDEIVRRGESFAHGDVKVTYRKGGTRTSWNTDGLKGYAVANPDVLKFMKETKTKPTASVSVKK